MNDPPTASNAAPPATWAGFKRGFLPAAALSPGNFIYGIAFGLLARQETLSLLEAMLMSLLVFSGTAQLTAVSAMGHGYVGIDAIVSIATAILLLNARYLLYGAALWPWLGTAPTRQILPTLFYLGDASWVMSMRAHAGGERDLCYVLGAGAATIAPWLLGTLTGSTAGGLLTNPAALGLDFLLVAFSASMGLAMIRARPDRASAVAALVVALAVDRFAPGGWTIVAAGLAGGLVTYVRYVPK
ncbi:MAG: AzlC family ABC transporter permease [Proteobacteria bacterium]|nr:AzlC family ABC transporter permease [Pseudomonadota bacterium]